MTETVRGAEGSRGAVMINDDMDDDRHEASSYERVELITGRQRRRQWTAEEKADIVLESFARGANISEVARRHGVSRGLLSVWRRQAQAETGDGTNLFVPVEVGQEQAASEAMDRLADIALPSSAGSAAGRIEFDLRRGRLVFSGGVDPGLAAAIVEAARSRR